MAKIDPLDKLVEDLRTYLRNRPAPTENDKRERSQTRKAYEYEYERDIKDIVEKWVNAATSRLQKSKRWEQGKRVKGDWGMSRFWKKGEVNWEYFENGVNHAREVTNEMIKKRLAHNDKIKAAAQKDSASPKSRKKKKDGIDYFGVCTDRAFNMLIKNEPSSVKVFGDFNYRVKWAHDVFSEKLWQHILKEKLLELKKEERQLLPTEDIVGMTKELFSSFREHLPVVKFTDKEFKEITGLKHLRNHEIAELVKEYIKLTIEGESKALLNPDTGKYTSITAIGSIADGFIEKTGKYSQRFHQPEHVYIFSLNFWGFVLFQNMLNKCYTKFPKEYYKLSGKAQELYRNIAQYGNSDFLPERVAKILGYAESTWSARIIKRASRYYDELKDAGLIDWKPKENKEGKFIFRSWKTAHLQLEAESKPKEAENSEDNYL